MKYFNQVAIDFSQRHALDGVDSLFPRRWSPRSFKKTPIVKEDLRIIMEAARWSPSAMNEQPWRIYTSTESSFDEFVNLLVPGNQQWAKNASVIGFFVAKLHYDRNGKDNVTCEFDCGAAWMAMTLQARMLGLYTHGMGGIEHEKVYDYLKLDKKEFKVMAGFAIGVIDAAEQLPEAIKAREVPSPRKPIEEIWKPI